MRPKSQVGKKMGAVGLCGLLPPSRAGRWRWTLLALPLVLSLGIPSGCGRPTTAPTDLPGPRISMTPEVIEVGEVEQFEEITRTVLIENPGDATLEITRVKTDCNCTASDLPRRTIEPGGEEEMRVTFSSGRLRGRVRRHVKIDSNDPERPRVRVRIVADVRETELPRIEVSPARWDVGRIDAADPVTGTFRILNGGEAPLEVIDVAGFPGCHVRWAGPAAIPPGGEVSFGVVLTPPAKGSAGVLGGEIRVESSDPMRPVIAVPVYAFAAGDVPSVWTEYPLWNFGALDPGEEAEKGFRVENRGTAPLRVRYSGSEGVAEGCRVDREGTWVVPPGEGWSIPIVITREAPEGVLNFILGFETNDPRRPVIHLGVVGYVRSEGLDAPDRLAEVPLSKINRREFRWFVGTAREDERVIDRTLVIRNDMGRTVHVERVGVWGGRCVPSVDVVEPGGKLVLESHFFPIETHGIGRWDVRIRARLGDAAEPKVLTVPVSGLLPSYAPIADLSSRSWNFGDVESGLEAVRKIRISNDGNRPLGVEAIRNPDQATVGISVTPPGAFEVEPGGFREVRLSLRDPFYRGTVYEEVVIRTTDPGSEEVRVVVEGHVRGIPIDPAPADRPVVRVLYSADELGRMGPCTCEEGQIGGFARAARLVAAQTGGSLLLHAGDLFGQPEPHLRLRAEVSMDILGRIGYQAMALGEGEMVFGREFMERSVEAAAFPVICANAFDAASGHLLTGTGWIILPQGDLRVGVIGLIGPELIPEDRGRDLGIRIEDPLDVLERETPKMRGECDLVILLAHMAADRLEGMLEMGPDVDLAIAGHGGRRVVHPRMAGRIPFVQNCDRGKYMARIDLVLSGEGEVVWAEGREFPLGEDVGEDEAVLRMIDEYRRRLRDLPAPEVIAEDGPAYVGAAECQACHPDEYARWKERGHAHALESLARSGSDYDPECLACHTSGYRRLGGFTHPKLTPEAGGVQCEACHGPASDHIRDRMQPYGDVPTPDHCLECHDAENSAHFDFDTYWPKIMHGPQARER